MDLGNNIVILRKFSSSYNMALEIIILRLWDRIIGKSLNKQLA
ncbi:hypothetical protein CWATWH8502_1037 [Crocosphaera watsonii WH 8502]|uniref:Uncharacterized protein n=5 Tax=Crocosphaera watsonii TaxID=263511 RepID=T2JXV5_CROWT|nr:hypothetical protein CWATWH0003_3735 [Crocosphaera watsonii WH 0003]CCQ49837.1 hypothetical protein CWATWH8502_1037 [Crocosphaera watsonii WH 8502]CCQ59350.1 hypothetical protein CWATWH0005_2304 [Crocosphaera watsonii WH 0005]CCQ60920.1 hypothetical protein CWATWH0401_2726 [Crocosphaera watsonii WH 0401]CCQ69477.1 hypothetical protein CWATWH0402_2968 [Crocosphaera watsonii WH 0402]